MKQVGGKLAIVIGTRPEAIKLAPLILELRQRNFKPFVLLTGQHIDMAKLALNVFKIEADLELKMPERDAKFPLESITSFAVMELSKIFKKENLSSVLVQGDTTSAFCGALSAFYSQIPVFHLEAGLRTLNPSNPFPEEMNRRLISKLANIHFAPTETAKKNLLNEGVNEDLIHVVGNTSIDAIRIVLSQIEKKPNNGRKKILLTCHRRENLEQNIKEIFLAVLELLNKYNDIEFFIPLHPRKEIGELAREVFKDNTLVTLSEHLSFDQMVAHIDSSYLVLTDSGGMQEEAPFLNKPVLVLREETERVEGIEANTLKIAGTNKVSIVLKVSEILDDSKQYQQMQLAQNPYGDGFSAYKIANLLEQSF